MSNKNIEIEIKFPLENSAAVAKFLDKNAKSLSKGAYQKDSYFVPSHRDFLAPKYPFEWLRLRESLKGTFITYKHFYPENAKKIDYCDEFETEIGNFDAMGKIFKSLDFREAVIVEKRRSTWMFEDVEVAIDDVTDLGPYIELEAKGDFGNVDEANAYLHGVLEKLDAKVGEQDFRGYPFRVLETKKGEYKS